MCAWCWLWAFVCSWLWRRVPGFFHPDFRGAALYALVGLVGVVLLPTLVFAGHAIVQKKPDAHLVDGVLDKEAQEAWKSRRDFGMELAILVLILFEAFVGLLSVHLQNDESAQQNTSSDTLNKHMEQTVTELQKAGKAISDQLNLLKDEHVQEMRDRAKKPILTLVTSKQLSAVKTPPWSPISSPVPVEDYMEHACGNQQIRPGRIFLGVQNKGEVRATNGSLTFVLQYGFEVKCAPMTCSTEPQDIHIPNRDTDVTVPFEVSSRTTKKFTLEFSAGYETELLVLRRLKMKTDQTDEENLDDLTVITCLSKTKP